MLGSSNDVASVPVTVTGGPTAVEIREMPRHKKNPAIGTKKTAYSSEIIIDQQDAQSFAIDEEVGYTLWRPCTHGSHS